MASCIHPTPVSPASRAAWRAAQWTALAATAILVAALVVWPEFALRVLWNVLIPLLPASFLITPALWRGLCPLATLNMLSNGLAKRWKLPSKLISAAGFLGILLLVVLVPARRFLFNENGIALAATISVVGAAAFALGAFFDAKAGFCNSLCPVLPVERLYGQHPLLKLGNPRCLHCTVCVPHGCLDLGPAKSLMFSLGTAHRQNGWLTSAYGVFAAAFPGFVVGYYTTSNTTLATAGTVYLHIAAWAVGSYVVTVLVVRMLNVKASLALPVLAAMAVALYYWFAAPLIASAVEAPGTGAVAVRAAALTLVILWLCQALQRANVHPADEPFAGVKL